MNREASAGMSAIEITVGFARMSPNRSRGECETAIRKSVGRSRRERGGETVALPHLLCRNSRVERIGKHGATQDLLGLRVPGINEPVVGLRHEHRAHHEERRRSLA